MEGISREIVLLETMDGLVPFQRWFDKLRDHTYQRFVDVRLTRIADGNFGDHKSVGGGVHELRIPRGPGLRIYYGLDGPRTVVLILGGDKVSQRADIGMARRLWREYLNAK